MKATEPGNRHGEGESPPRWEGSVGSRRPRPGTLAPDDDRFLLSLAVKISRRRLAAPATLWLDSIKPLSFLGSQVMHFTSPFVHLVGDGDGFDRLAGLLEERSHLDRLLDHLAAVDGAPETARKESSDG